MYIKERWFESLRGAKILAVNPPVYDFAWFDLWAKPAGLLNFLGYLRERGNEVELIDCLHEGRLSPLTYGRWKTRREERDKPAPLQDIPRRYFRFGLSEEDFRLRLKEKKPDLILLTSIMSYWYPGVAEAITALRAAHPRTPLILGGIYATLCPAHASSLGADQVLPAQASPRASRLPLDLYPEAGYAVLSTSLGCPRRCHYCASSLLQPKFASRPSAETIADLEGQLNPGPIEDLAFYDDALLLKKEETLYPLLEYISSRHPRLRLHSPNGLSVEALDKKCCRILKRAGFRTLRLSFEGLDRRTRAASDNKVDAPAYQKAVENLLEAGFSGDEIETYLLIGLPEQRIEDVEESIEYVKKTGAKAKICEYSPIPGTVFFQKEAERNPLIAHEPLWHNNSIYAAHLSGRLEPDELQRLKTLSRGK